MRILILNWRDIKNPASGGAEILTHELAKGWVKSGNKVTQFTSRFKNSKEKETIDGVEFIRRGQWWNVHIFAFFYYISNRNKIEIIVDEVHWFPFFSVIYAKKKTVALTCELANKLFFALFPYPIALIFRGLEKIYLRLYKNIPTMVISESTKSDLIHEGYNKNKLYVLPMGLSIPKGLKKYYKEKNPTLIYLARINKQKGIFDAIDAFALIKKEIKNSKFWIVGTGEELTVNSVKKRVDGLDLSGSVKFFGFVTEEKKFELLTKAHILLIPSVHEGWGLTVAEAATQQTPSIVYNVPGLRDVSRQTLTSIILNKDTSTEMANEAVKIYKNKKLYRQLQNNGLNVSARMTWDKAAEESLKVLTSYSRK